jgi:hypothetical protein
LVELIRPELVVTVLLAGTIGFLFHSIVGTRARTIPICLALSIIGFLAGDFGATAAGLTWPSLGGIAVLPAVVVAVVILLIANRFSLC